MNNHEYRTVSNAIGAFGEAWAEYFAAAIWNNPKICCGNLTTLDINDYWKGTDENGTTDNAEKIEGAIASILWDIADGDGVIVDNDGDGIGGLAQHAGFMLIWKIMVSTGEYPTFRTFWDKWFSMGFSLGIDSYMDQQFRIICENNGIVYSRGITETFVSDPFSSSETTFGVPSNKSEIPLLGAFSSIIRLRNSSSSIEGVAWDLYNVADGQEELAQAVTQITTRQVEPDAYIRPGRTHVYPNEWQCQFWEKHCFEGTCAEHPYRLWTNIGDGGEISSVNHFIESWRCEEDYQGNPYYDDPYYWSKMGMCSGYYLLRVATEDDNTTWDSNSPMLGIDYSNPIYPTAKDKMYTTEWLCDVGAWRVVEVDLERPRLEWIVDNVPPVEDSYKKLGKWVVYSYPEDGYPATMKIRVRLTEPYNYSVPLRGSAFLAGEDYIVGYWDAATTPRDVWMAETIEVLEKGDYSFELDAADPLRDGSGNEAIIFGYYKSPSSSNKLDGDFVSFDPTFVQMAESRTNYGRQYYWSRYTHGYLQPERYAVTLSGANYPVLPLRKNYSDGAQLSVMGGNGEKLISLNRGNIERPQLLLPIISIGSFDAKEAIRNCLSWTTSESIVTDTDAEGVVDIGRAYNGYVELIRYSIAEQTMHIEDQYRDQV